MNNSSVHFRKLLPQVQKNLNAFRNLKKGQEPYLFPVHEDQLKGAHTTNSTNFDFFCFINIILFRLFIIFVYRIFTFLNFLYLIPAY